MNKRVRKRSKKTARLIGAKPFEGYEDIAKEELKDLEKLTMREARIQTEILLRAAKWMR